MAWTKEQEQAIYNYGHNIIVSAGAGSGKTAVLSERVINHINNGIHVNELLILTFTNKAAKEMKDRIKKKLVMNNMTDEINLLSTAHITTFDSYALEILKKYHYLLNISSDTNITEQSIIELIKKEVLDQIFDEYYENSNPLFLKMIDDFSTKSDKEIRKYLLNIANKINNKPDCISYLDNYQQSFLSNEYYQELINNYEQLIINKINSLKIELENNMSYFTDDYNFKLANALSSLFNITNLEDFSTYVKITLPMLPKNSDEDTKLAKERIKSIYDEITSYCDNSNRNIILEELKSTNSNILIIIEILKTFFERLDFRLTKDNLYDFNRVSKLSLKLINDYPIVSSEIKNSLKEIMVDEYQDTNDIQEAFISKISNNNVYMVGDIKQSIYRFRNANPSIFKDKYDNYKQGINGEAIDLLKNFRSRSEVLNNINLIFNPIMDNYLGDASYIESHQMNYGNNIYSENINDLNHYDMSILEYSDESIFTKEEIESFIIAKDIIDKIKNKYQIFDKDTKTFHDATFNDFTILCDRTQNFDLYKNVLEYFKISASLEKDSNINETNLFLIVNNLINLVIKLHDQEYDSTFKLAFLSVFRSFLYNYNDQELLTIFKDNNFIEQDSLKPFIELATKLDELSICDILEQLFNIVSIETKLIKINNIKENIIVINKILELAKSYSNNIVTIYDFSKYLNDLIENNIDINSSILTDSGESVKMMTIHKSKGLEFNIAYFPGLYKTFNINELKDLITYSEKYGIVIPINKEGIKNTIIKSLLKNNYIEQEISERIRLFYVALTRVKEQIILLAPKRDLVNNYTNEMGVINNIVRLRFNSFLDIINALGNRLNEYRSTIDIDALGLTKEYLIKENKLYTNTKNKTIDINEININVVTNDINNYSKKIHELINKEINDNLAFGNKIHNYLEDLNLKNPRLDLIKEPFIKNKITNLLNNELFKNISDAVIYQEYEFINDNNHGKIDLMLEYADHIDIIDYKLSNILDENYLKQLNGYKSYINTISKKTVNMYLYSILEEKVRKVD